jgi:hypothetical protein
MSSSTSKEPLKLSKTALNEKELALIELYQRQDALSTQLWQHFLIVNAAVVAVVALIAAVFGKKFGEDFSALWLIPVLGIWGIFTYGSLSAILNSQKVLLAIGHQIESDLASQTDLFAGVTRSPLGIRSFHLGVDLCILILCYLLTRYLPAL